MSELDKFVNDNYDKLLTISRTITGSKHLTFITTDADDLLHETLEILYKKINRKKISKLIKKNKLVFFIVRIMINQFHSSTSPYYYKYKKYYRHVNGNYNTSILWAEHWLNNIPDSDGTQEKIELEEMLNNIENQLKDYNWFDAEVFKVYYLHSHSLNTLSKETGINRNTLYKSISKIKKKLKNET